LQIILYKSADDPIKVNKTLTNQTAVEVKLLDIVDISAPRFIINYSESLLQYNYCYVPAFRRYYYLTPPQIESGQRMILNCYVDVLKTAAQAIAESDATIIRCSEATDINDESFPVGQEYWLESYFSDDIAERAQIHTHINYNLITT